MDHPLDMSPDEFRQAGLSAIDWIADFLSQPEDHPVLSRATPGSIEAALPESAPREGEPFSAILEDFRRIVVPGITHWNHPGFFAYFGITGSGPGILGELLCSALNVNAMLWKTSPAATELEVVVLDWLRRLLGLPDTFHGVITDTASISTFCALAAARHALTDLGIRDRGMAGRDLPRLRVYTSEQAHSSVDKAAIALGLGAENVRKIPTDERFRLSVDALAETIRADRAVGHRPMAAVATVGTTSTTSVDPVAEIAPLCDREDIWLHVDAAYAGAAAVVPEFRHVLAGCDAASSVVVNPHKWLFTPIDCSALYTRRPDLLTGAFSLVPEYLRTDVAGEVRDYMDWGIQLGRRFRALKLWMVLRWFGSDGLAERLRSHIDMAQEFAGWVDDDPDFERVAPTPLSVVCFRARPRPLEGGVGGEREGLTDLDGNVTGMGEGPEAAGEPAPPDSGEHDAAGTALDEFNERLLEAVNATGEVYLSHTRLDGRYALRLAIGNIRTRRTHVARAWELLRRESARLLREEGAAP